MNVVRSFVNYAIFRELCDRMRFEVDCAKSHHRVISEGLLIGTVNKILHGCLEVLIRLWAKVIESKPFVVEEELQVGVY